MKFLHLLATAVASVAVHGTAVTQQQSQLSMCVTTAIGTCGNYCQPFDCAPNYTLVSSFENMIFDIAGMPGTSYVLFVGVAVPGCMVVPGIEGALATWTPTAPIAIGALGNLGDPLLPCTPAVTHHNLGIPAVPPGVDIRFQLLGVNGFGLPSPVLSFSRPTEVRTR